MKFNQLLPELVTKIFSFVPDLYYFSILNLVDSSWYQTISKVYSKDLIYQKCKEYDMNSIILHYHHFVNKLLEENYMMAMNEFPEERLERFREEYSVHNIDVMFIELFFKDRVNIPMIENFNFTLPNRLMEKKIFIGYV